LGSKPIDRLSHYHPIPSLLALSVILLELHLNAPIMDHITGTTLDLRLAAMLVLEDCKNKDAILRFD
jgi:hypothetical protein